MTGSLKKAAGKCRPRPARKWVERAQWVKQANNFEAGYLHESLRYKFDGHKHEGRTHYPADQRSAFCFELRRD